MIFMTTLHTITLSIIYLIGHPTTCQPTDQSGVTVTHTKLPFPTHILPCMYRTTGNCRGRKLSQMVENKTFVGENFHRLLPPKDATPPNFTEKTFTNSHKTTKFVKPSKVFHWMQDIVGNEATLCFFFSVYWFTGNDPANEETPTST